MDKNGIVEFWKDRLWRFFRVIALTNRDFPYHDYFELTNEDEENDLNGCYQVGTSNVDKQGDQHKRFVAKRTVIWADTPSTSVRLNDSKNVEVFLPIIFIDVASNNLRYGLECHANINEIHYTIPAEGTISIYCEGVLPDEARDAE